MPFSVFPLLCERKSPKSAHSVRIELPRFMLIKRNTSEAATDALSSGGIIALSAQMRFVEYPFAALCIFAHGWVRRMGLSLRIQASLWGCPVHGCASECTAPVRGFCPIACIPSHIGETALLLL